MWNVDMEVRCGLKVNLLRDTTPFQKLFINTMVVTGMVVPSVIQIAKKLLIETMLHVKKNIKTH